MSNESAVPGVNKSPVPGINKSAVPGINESDVPGINESAVPGVKTFGCCFHTFILNSFILLSCVSITKHQSTDIIIILSSNAFVCQKLRLVITDSQHD